MSAAMRQEIAVKHQRVVRFLTEHGLDGVLLTRRCNFCWYTAGAYNHVGLTGDVGRASLLVTAEGATVLTNNIEAERQRGEGLAGRGIPVADFPWHDAAGRAQAFARALAGRKVAADAPLADVRAAPLPQAFDELRWTLLEVEIERYRRLAVDVAMVTEVVCRAAKPGNTEYELAGLVQAMLSQRNCLAPLVLVGGERRVTKYRHPLPTPEKLGKHALLAVGAERDGLIVSCTRLIHFGKPPAELTNRQRAVAAIDAALIDATRPLAALGDILACGIAAYAEQGFPEQWRQHHQGGSCGYQSRDVLATPGEPTGARENQAFAWNPSLPGAKSEDTILCTAAGPEILSATGDWPTIKVEVNGRVYERPAILEL